jgi:hypothetical protein
MQAFRLHPSSFRLHPFQLPPNYVGGFSIANSATLPSLYYQNLSNFNLSDKMLK